MDLDSLDGLRPNDYRARYVALMESARERASLFAGSAPSGAAHDIAVEAVHRRQTIPAGWYASFFVRRGRTLRIVNTSGTPGVGAFFWNADDTSERYCVGDTVKIQWTVRLGPGRLLLSDMGRVLCAITADTSDGHDTLLGGTTRASVSEAGRRNTRDNLILAAGKHGLGKRDIAPFITFFAGVASDDHGRFAWRGDAAPVGRFVDLRAHMNLLVALSNTPHPLAPASVAAGSVDAIVWSALEPVVDDFVRTATAEAARAFENTDASFQ